MILVKSLGHIKKKRGNLYLLHVSDFEVFALLIVVLDYDS